MKSQSQLSKGWLYLCIFSMLVIFIPQAKMIEAASAVTDGSEGMVGSRIPVGTTYTSTTYDPTFVPQNIGDGDWHSIWKVSSNTGRIQMNFPEAVNLKGVQVSTGGAGDRYETYTIRGLQNGYWRTIATRTFHVTASEYQALTPIAVQIGWYEGIDISVSSTRNWLLMSEVNLGPTTTSIAPTQLKATNNNEEVSLQWQPLANVDHYQIRYGTTSGHYTETITVSADTYTDVQIPDLTTGTAYYFTVAGVRNGVRTNYATEVLSMPVPGYNFPVNTGKSASSEFYRNPVENTMDRDIASTWKTQNNSKNATLSYLVGYPLYINELQFVITAPVESDITYKIYEEGEHSNTLIGQKTVHVQGSTSPIAINSIPIEPDWYQLLKIEISSTAAPVVVNELLYKSDLSYMTGLQATPQNGKVHLTWDTVPAADQYRITYMKQYPDILLGQTITVNADKYQNYTVSGLDNNSVPYYFVVNAVVNGQNQNYSNIVHATPMSYATGDPVPKGTTVTSVGYYDNQRPEYTIDGDLSTYWIPNTGNHKSGTINYHFPKPVSLDAIQLVSMLNVPGKQAFTIYGLQGNDWNLLYDGKIQAYFNPFGGVLAPIPVPAGKYEGIMILTETTTTWVTFQELLLFYSANPHSTVLTDTYSDITDPTVSTDTYSIH
ncbi:hypothetical protein QE450_000607 [Paenibacillus sp. SORGH_AS306]|uniref:fibronectin type III domain-containing protein n=1 Tax=unclassified Paenibacillus TaxID=185978 RepID=UPI0027879056|nr:MULTISPECIES: fibronectin type III domain-containing protein [unclassified Paenibacillus]MDQ1233109.1 hypothetical protein [Paenibacillus sp. SORGH_AS_0306]MDR6110156.1 hypothetical protein [Paenibacillus sp. SORGH_AS_0338]